MSYTYPWLQRLMHRVMAILVLVMGMLGLSLPRLDEGPLADFFYEAHKSIGLLLMALLCFRLILRFYHGAAPDPANIQKSLYRFAKFGHGLIYVLLLIVPIIGFIATTLCCAPVMFLGLIPIPLVLAGSEDLVKQLFAAHQWGAYLLLLLAGGHIGMGIWHRKKGDGIYERMWPVQTGSTEKGSAA
jgi:cytochrome b561